MQHIWYWPEYGPDYYNMTLIDTLVSKSIKTIHLDDIICNVHENNVFSIDIERYTNWREKWVSLIPTLKQVVKSKQFFSSKKTNPDIRVLLYHVDNLSQKEWSMFLLSPFRVDIITRSLTSIHPSYLAKTQIHRVSTKDVSLTWKEAPWKISAERLKENIKHGFTHWRTTRDILYEWMLFTVDVEQAIFDVFQILHEKSLKNQAKIMRKLLYFLSFLSINKNREVIKSTIRATTNQHTFYILEQCILVIAKEYHSEKETEIE